MKVLAALSGGVDSAVAAARAVDAGHDVVGVHMALSRNRDQMRAGSRGCCTIEDASDARRAAAILNIPYYVWDLSEQFEETVVSDFLSEYEAGRTPNPCVRCNEHIKFQALLDKGVALGFDAVCTGHYARIVEIDGVRQLHRAVDSQKDQSYVLAVMGPERLAKAIFPLGDVASKDEVRAEAEERGLGISNKPDSYDICFVADGNTQGFLRERLGKRPGEIVDVHGEVLGRHDGAYAFTIGQRKGLAIGKPTSDGKPRYVLEVQPDNSRVVVGPQELLTVHHIFADAAVWFIEPPTEWLECSAQIRAHGRPLRARVRASGEGELEVELIDGVRGLAPGQSCVVYSDSQVLGQATISKTVREMDRMREFSAIN